MATWRVSFTDPADRYIAEQYDAKDASYWQDTLRTRAKPGAGMPGGLQALVEHLAPEYGIDPAFASAIAQTESNYQPGVVSSAGAKGVMQLMDQTGKRFGVRDPFDPEQNIRGGLAYLKVLQDLFPGRRDLQMAAYNAGEGAVKKYGNTIPPYPETQDYVRKVSSRLARTTPQGAMMQAPMTPRQPQAPPRDPAATLPMEQEFVTPPVGPTMPDVTGTPSPETSPQAGGEAIPEVWMPAPKPIEKAFRTAGTFLGSIGAGFARGAANIIEAPTTALRMAGMVEEEGKSPLEQGADWLRETFVKPMEQLEARQPRLLMQIGEGIGQAGTFLAPGIAIERGIAAMAGNAPKIAAMFGATTSGVLQGAVAMNDTYQALKPLVGEEEAGKRAQTAFATNTLLGTVGSALGVFNRWVPDGLSRVVAAAVAEGGTEAVQYDWNRRLFWVAKDAPQVEAVRQMGWQEQGDRLVQPYRFKDQLEAALVGSIVGGLLGAGQTYLNRARAPGGAGSADPLSQLPLPEGLADVAMDEGFTVPLALEAAMQPASPPAEVPLSRWQRWGNAVLDLLPELPAGAIGGRSILGSEMGALGKRRDVIAGRGAGALAAGHNRIRAWTQAMGDQVADLTPEDRREAFTRSKAILQEQVQTTGRNLPTTEELLKLFDAGKDSADWYAGTMEELRMHFGEDAEIVAGLIAATSPQTRPRRNVQLALQAYGQWKAGDEIQLNTLQPSIENAKRVLRGEAMSGPKINNFYRNLLGDPEAVTADIWMMRLMRLVKPGANPRETPTTNQYRLIEEWTTQLAQQAGVTPRDMQAALWVGYKILNPIPGETAEQVATPLRDIIRGEVERRGGDLPPMSPEVRQILGSQGGSADVDMMIHLAMGMAGGLAGCLRGETTQDCIVNALAGAGLGVIASVSTLRYLRRNLRTFAALNTTPGAGGLLQRQFAQAGDVATEGDASGAMPTGEVPTTEGLFSRILSSERGSISPQRMELRKQRRTVDQQLRDLEVGGEDAQRVLDTLGTPDADEAHAQLMEQRAQITEDLAALPPEPVTPVPLATPETAVPAETPMTPADLSVDIPPTEAELAQAYQPEGVTPDRFRTESGRWRTPLRDLPTQELEIQDAIRQQTPDGRWGIKLAGETEMLGELQPLLSATRAENQPLMAEGIQGGGLLNNRNGFTPQQMAERLAEHGFLATADKEALKLALDRSLVEGQNVYSVNATGYVPLADSPMVAAAHASVQELVRNFAGRTEEQRRGTRPHAVAISEAQTMIDAGGWTKQDVLDMLPGTIMDDTGIAQVVITAREVTNQMVQAAQKVMETGGRDPRAVEDYLTIKSMFADIHIAVTGVAAESGRILSMWNDPMAPHKRYMDGLKDLMLQHGNETALKMARADLSLATPEETALARQLKTEADTQFQEAASRGWLAGPDFAPMRDDWMQQQTLFPADQINETWATVMGEEMPLAVSPDPGTPPLPEGQGPGLPYHLAQGRSPQQMRREAEGQRRAVQDFVRKMRDEAGLPSETALQQRRHAADPLSRMHDPSAEELPLFTPSELEPRLKQALGWELLTPDERRAAQEALAKFAGYSRRPDMADPEAMAQPLMLGAEPSQAPSDVTLGREAGLTPAQLRVMQANLGQAQPGKWAMVLEQWKAALLGPPTWIANAVSNTSMGIYSLPVRFFAGVASQVRQGAEAVGNQLGTRDTGPIEPGVSVWETGDLLYGMTHGWMDHLRAMAQTWRTGESRIDTGPGKTDAHQKAVTAENLGLEGTTVGKVMEFWAEHIGFMSFGRDTFRVLNTADEAYLSVFYTMERQALAQAEARAQGLQGLSRAEVMSKVMSDPNVAEWIHTQAVDQAKLLTLRTDIPTEGIASALGRLSHWRIGSEESGIPVGQLVTPFYTVPTNAAIQTIDNSPLALLSSKFYADLAAGGRKADMAMGKLITGSLTAAAVASLVGAMALTGRAPADPVQKEIFLQEHPEYSAYVPGLGIWVDYRRWLGPLGNSIAVVADAAQLMGELSGPLAERAAAAAYLSLTRNLVGQTGWRDIGDFLEILNGGRNVKNEDASDVLKSLSRYARQKTASIVGIPATLGLSQSANARLLVRALDPEEKLAKTYLDQLYSATPGWSAMVRRRRTITGEPELYGGGVGPDMLKPFTRAFFPGLKAVQEPLNAADQAIADHDMHISKVSDTLLPIGVMQASSDVESFRGMQPTKLTPNEHERLEVLAAMNEAQAKMLYGTAERVIPPETMRLVTESAALRAQAAADPMGGSPLLLPPKEEMSLGEMWNWLTTTPAFERGSPGRGGGKEKAFQTATQEYQKWGQELFLELEPDIGGRHAQSRIQRQIQPYAPVDRESMRLTLEEAHMATRPAMRGVMGLPALSVGGP